MLTVIHTVMLMQTGKFYLLLKNYTKTQKIPALSEFRLAANSTNDRDLLRSFLMRQALNLLW